MRLFGFKLGNILLSFLAVAIVSAFVIAIINYDNRAVYDLFMVIALIETMITSILLYIERR